MAWPKGMPRGPTPGSGRKKGSRSAKTLEVEAYARGIIDNPDVRKKLLEQAIDGTLPAPLMQMFFSYGYGKPVDRVHIGEDQESPFTNDEERQKRIDELETQIYGLQSRRNGT